MDLYMLNFIEAANRAAAQAKVQLHVAIIVCVHNNSFYHHN